MNEKTENKLHTPLIAILDSFKKQMNNLAKEKQEKYDSDKFEKEKDEILSKIEIFERCIKIGIIKKIDSMSHDELLNIALKSLSIVTKDINPSDFISTYNSLKRYVSNYTKEEKKTRSFIPDLTFTVEGPFDVLVDKDGNPRSDFKIVPEEQERVNNYIKNRKSIGNTRFHVKVDSNYFTSEELSKMGLSFTSAGLPMNGFTIKWPDNYILNSEQTNNEHYSQQYFKISSDSEAARKLSKRYYNIFDCMDCNKKIVEMEIILSEIQKKQKLLSDSAYLKEYVQKLLTNDPEFIDKYLADKQSANITSKENQHLYDHNITNLSDEDINSLLINLSSVSDDNLKKMFDTIDKIDKYIKVIESIKRKISRDLSKSVEELDNSEMQSKIAECDKKIATLKKLREQYQNSSVENSSTSNPQKR